MGLEGEVAVITGGGRGLGSALATALAEEGARIAHPDLDEATVLDTAAAHEGRGFEALGARCDVTDEHDVDWVMQQAHDRFGRIESLVNNAGLHQRKSNQPFGSLTRDELRALSEVNVMGIINCLLACQPMMASTGGGAIVNIASVSGE